MRNICFLIGNIDHSGGTERVTTIIANEFAKKNKKVHILSLSGGKSPFFEQCENIVNSNLFETRVSMRWHFLPAISKIRKYLAEHRIDTLIVVDSISCVFTVPACFGLNINHICWEHFNLKVNLGSRFRDLGRWMAAKWCSRIVTLTERDKNFWDGKYNLATSNKVIAIANPSPYPLQDNLPLLSNKNILCVGRLTHQKGFDLLIPAWAKIANQFSDWKVTIVGSGEDEQMLKHMAESSGVAESIIFAGQQKDMDQFYRKASFFCMSSRFEGLPMVLLEAQSYGLPIVSFDCDTGPAEVITNEENGVLVQSLNIDKLSEALVYMINVNSNHYSELILNSKSSTERFKTDSVINIWEKF
ncbi:glycosyltransferase family 4 protein [Acinetobacter schindleri]|uniref:glycosyltransferase family 4 protein n=1 Tax=Acinetobacter schindleri TaxID=108981 RepID=UPI0013B07DCD|nr:glycosyltransferase family 4 protein [Acinetobacter schindleri]QIC61255.1 glycosyltransferase family 4 protein [Acinetobacter schindleri]